MVNSGYISYELRSIAIVIWILLFIILLIVRRVVIGKNPKSLWVKAKLWHILLTLTVLIALIFFCWGYFIKVSSEQQISQMLKYLNTCTKLKVSITSPEITGKYIQKDFRIDEKERINKLLGLLKNRNFTRVSNSGAPSTGDQIEIIVYSGDEEVCWFRIIVYLLEIGEKTDFSRYECSDKDIMFNIPKELGLPGWK